MYLNRNRNRNLDRKRDNRHESWTEKRKLCRDVNKGKFSLSYELLLSS